MCLGNWQNVKTSAQYLFAAFALVVALTLPHIAFGQYGGQGLGSALSSNPLSHQGQVKPGVDDLAAHVAQETPFKIIKDVKLGLKDADPNVRVSELTKLRYLEDPEVNVILINSMSDPDIRVKMKAIDLLGAREANAAITVMSSMLFLRSTEPIVKLHLAELGRIGDAQGTLPVMQFLGEDQDERGRGTAVFALGEIGSDKAAPLLKRVVAEDQSAMIRRLAKEAGQTYWYKFRFEGQLIRESAKTDSKIIASEAERPPELNYETKELHRLIFRAVEALSPE